MKKLLILLFVFCFSCNKDYTPKPHAYLRLDYPEPEYSKTETNLPFTFDINKLATNIKTKKMGKSNTSIGVDLEYQALKGTIYLTYKKINDDTNLVDYFRDAQNFTQEHTKKADEISEIPYEDSDRKVYGMFYEVGGNAASQSQFYVTDSVNHFLTGSLYFYTKPNYDSILPAASYLQRDIQRIMESVIWK